MKVGFIAHGTGTQGGIESVVHHLALQSARLGHEVTVYSMRPPTSPLPGIRRVEVRVPRLPWALQQFAFALASAKAVREHPVEVLEAHVNTFAPAQVPVCHSVHPIGSRLVRGLDPNPLRRAWHWLKTLAPLVNWLAGENYRRPETKLAVPTSNGIARELESLYPGLKGRMRMIPNGIDPKLRHPAGAAGRARQRARLGLKKGEHALLFIGKEFHRKGLEPVIRALPLLPGGVKLWVIGNNVDAVPAGHFTAVVEELGLRDRVRFWGHQSGLLPFYQAADAFVFPTLYEAFAMVSIESMACGLPLLACRANGTEDLIVEGKNGAFVTRDGASIAAAVRKWILPPARRRKLSAGALKTSRDYSWDKIARRHMDVCREALGMR